VQAFDFTRPPRTWKRAQRVQLATQLHTSMSTAEVARRLDVSRSTVRDYLSDPDGARARQRRASAERGRCARCGTATGAARGTRQFALCLSCAGHARASWTAADVLDAYLTWWRRFGDRPTSSDWHRTRATRRGGEALERFNSGRWPTASVIVRLFGGFRALTAAAERALTAELPVSTAAHPPRTSHGGGT